MQQSFHHLLMKAHFVMHRRVMTQAKALGLTSGQPKILEFLSECEGVEQKVIARSCEIEPATVGSILDRMESAGLIERRREAGNRRSLYVYLTDAGKSAAAKTEEIFSHAEQDAFEDMDEAEIAALCASLQKIYRNLTK